MSKNSTRAGNDITERDASRLYSKVSYTTTDPGCWEFTGYLDKDGYGRFFSQGRTRPAHRVAYELAYGPVPPGMAVDHTCNNRSCIRYEHLEAVTTAENNRRAAERRTHCRAGHEYTEESTYWWGGARRCRLCNRLAVRRYYLRQKEQATINRAE
jgi:HNH endonuclease